MNNMDFEDKLTEVAVIGAAGKMGRGIVLCLLTYFANNIITGKPVAENTVITAIDPVEAGLRDMLRYLKKQMLKYAERNIIAIRARYTDNESLVENAEHIDFFIRQMTNMVATSTQVGSAAGAQVVFEATPEDLQLKADILKPLANQPHTPWVLSNTSSIPIHTLSKRSGLGTNIIGFHFYNPPPVQKLIEIIPADATAPDLVDFATWLARALRKTAIFSKDMAGFIGNGIFIRELSYALQKVAQLSEDLSQADAIFIMNEISGKFLVRPMGIFQLADYVGLDICMHIAGIMQQFLKETFYFELFETITRQGIHGGQNADGSQKDGLFSYTDNHISGIFDPGASTYRPLPENSLIHHYKLKCPAWKALQKQQDRDVKLKKHFTALFATKNEAAKLTGEYLKNYHKAGVRLLELHTTDSPEDINQVMMLGFHQLYGPFNLFTEMI